jgi:hypothetical protein
MHDRIAEFTAWLRDLPGRRDPGIRAARIVSDQRRPGVTGAPVRVLRWACQIIGVLFAVALVLDAIPSTRRAILGGYYSDQLAALVSRAVLAAHVPDITAVKTSCEAASTSSQPVRM